MRTIGKRRELLLLITLTVLLAMGGVALADDGEDPDLPGFLSNIDGAEYLQLRQEHINLRRGIDPDHPFDPTARSRAVELMDAQQARLTKPGGGAAARTSPRAFPTWVELGPAPIPNGQTEAVVNSVTGRLTTMVADPTNTNILYVGTAQGGVWRSLDGGASFVPIFDGAQSLAIGALTLDPNDHTRLWVGTGEPNGSLDSFAGVGLYRVDSANTVPVLNGPINPVRSYLDGSSNPQNIPVFNGRSISRILVNPNDSAVLFVSTAGGVIGLGGDAPFGGTVPPLGLRGLYRLSAATGPIGSIGVERIKVSTAAGGFDTPNTGNRNVDDMVFDPADLTANTLVVWQNGTNAAGDGGIWRSTNALAAPGSSVIFTQTLATTSTSTLNGRGTLAIYKPAASPSVVYAASGEPSSGTSCGTASQSGAVRRSIDGGGTWSTKIAASGGFCGGQCFYNLGLAVVGGATTATDRIHLGGNTSSASCQRLHAVSTNGGGTFTNHDAGLHADTHFIYVDPNTNTTVYHLNDGGLWRSIDSGTTWTSLNGTGLKATQFQSLALHPSDPHFTIGGTQDNGTNNLQSGGVVWNRVDFGDGGFAAIDQNAADLTNVVMYHTYFNQTNNLIGFARVLTTPCAFDAEWSFKGRYGGAVDPIVRCDGTTDTFNGITITDNVLFYAPLALGPGTPNTVYFGTDRLYRSTNRGDTMTVVSQAPLVAGGRVSAIGISPQNDNVRIVGLQNGALFFTTTGSSTLTSLDPVAGASVIPDRYVARAVIDPADQNTAYITLDGFTGGTTAALSHVWKVTNLSTTPVLTSINGSAGANFLPDIPLNALAVDRSDPTLPGIAVLYVGTDIGVYRSTDGGTNWFPFGTGLPHVAVFDMAITPQHRLLRIATHGRGMWEISLSAAGTDTIGIFRPSTNTFFLRNSNTVGPGEIVVPLGTVNDTPLVGDWDGDGTTTIGVYRPSTQTFFLRNSNTFGPGEIVIPYGDTGDIPLAGDWDGTGTATIGVYRPSTSTFFLRNSNTPGAGDIVIPYGDAGDIPVVGDWDGNGTTTIGVYRPSTHTFFLRNSNTPGLGEIVVPYGDSGDIPVVGNWDGA